MTDIPEEGMREHVYSPDKKKDLGLGTIGKVEPLRIEEPGLTIAFTYPSRILVSEQADHVPRFEALNRYLRGQAGIKAHYDNKKSGGEKDERTV